jgi:hypothetical protein
MAEDFGTPITPMEEPKKKRNTTLIVIVVLILLCCCCAITAYLGYQLFFTWGDQLIEWLEDQGLYMIYSFA